MTRFLGGAELARAVAAALETLRARRASIDAANVYPVPDGDTGTNLVLTFEAVVAAVGTPAADDAAVARAVKSGSLMGARGNSGVLMAQILRGLADPLEAGPADVEAVARGFKRAVELAYEAVLEPAEGTILSVARGAADAAQGEHADVAAQFEAAAAAAAEALARTPDQMPLLARAGVVDAGGMGLVAVLAAFAATLSGGAVEESQPEQPARAPCEGSFTFAHEVQYMLAAPDERIPALRHLLGTIGDSVAVIGGDGAWRVHVHTDDREAAVRFGEAVGAVSALEVVTFAEQVAPSAPPAPEAPAVEEPRAPGARGVTLARATGSCALVAVANGAGAQRLFRELGAIVVDGGATMNPSVGELLAAISSAPADRVLVLPNNDDAFAAARAAAGESPKTVTVLRSADLGEGLAAAVAFGEARAVEDNLADMLDVLARVRTGQVAISTLTGETPIGHIQVGQALGFAEGKPVAIEGDPVAAAAAVAAALLAPGASVLSVLCGTDVDDAERQRVTAALERAAPALAVEVHDGGQPVHRYVLAVE